MRSRHVAWPVKKTVKTPRMAHQQQRKKKFLARFFTLLLLTTLLVDLVPLARADSGGGTCSGETVNTGVDTNIRSWVVVPSDTTIVTNAANSCQAGNLSPAVTLRDVNAGASITLKCYEGTAGAAAPSESEAVVIKGFPDNDNFGNTGAAPIWTWTVTGGNCGASPTNTVFCTSDGTNGGALRYGIVRIQVHASRTTIPAYDSNSEAANPTPQGNNYVGIYRCNPKPTVMQPTNTPAGTNVWVGGNTYDERVTLDSAPYGSSPGNTGDLRVNCANRETTPVAGQFTTTAVSSNVLIAGTPDAFKTGCTLKHNATLTKTSAISLYSGTLFAIWNTASPITGVTFPSSTVATFTSKTLNRIMTNAGTCAASPNPVNRGATETVSNCHPWSDANGVQVPNNKNGAGWYQRAGQYESWDDFPSVNTTFGAQGQLSTALAAKSAGCANTLSAPAVAGGCATVTTGSAYHKMVQTCTAACLAGDANLENWGNTTGVFDVSSTWTFDGINISKTTLGVNASSFVIGTDIEFARAKGLRDINGVLLSGITVNCQRTRPDSATESSVSMGTTDVSGNSPEQQFQVLAPQGTWQMTCTATASGNGATYTISFFHQSAFTADTVIGVKWNTTFVPGNSTFLVNISAIIRVYDPTTDSIVASFPDEAPKLRVMRYDPITSTYSSGTLINRAVMLRDDGPTSAAFYYLFWASPNDLRDDYAFVNANLTGRPFLGVEGFALQPAGDFAVFGNITVYGNATVTQNVTATHLVGEGGNITNVTQPDVDDFVGNAYFNATACKNNTTCSGNFTGNFSGNGLQVNNVTAVDIAAINGPGWTLLPYIIILGLAFLLVLAGSRIGPGFSLIGSIVAIIVALASLGDASASGLLKSFLMVAALASILATIAIKRNSRSF